MNENSPICDRPMPTRSDVRPSLPAINAPTPQESILPSTPAEELVVAISTGDRPIWLTGVTCSSPKREFDEVSEPVIATPSHPSTGENTTKSMPAEARALPRVAVWPERFITKDRPSTAITVTMVKRSLTRVSR